MNKLVKGSYRYNEYFDVINRSGFFDEEWYKNYYQDVRGSRYSGLEHYILYGADELRAPSLYFDTAFYMEENAYIKASGINPLVHYILYGQNEGKKPLRDEVVYGNRKGVMDLVRHTKDFNLSTSYLPLISIIMPTKNRKEFIKLAIQSVLNQTYPNWELIVVDDYSSDKTLDMIRRHYPDKRIKGFKNTKKTGVSNARNFGLEQAGGEYIAYLDSDNTWSKYYLEFMVRSFNYLKVDCGYAILKKYVGADKEVTYLVNPFNYELFKDGNYIDLNVFMHKKSLYVKYGGFDARLNREEDFDLLLKYCKHGNTKLFYFIGAYYNEGTHPRLSNTESSNFNYLKTKYKL